MSVYRDPITYDDVVACITREEVLKAIEEHDRMGRDAFLRHYGYGRAKSYHLVHNGRLYDSKAIMGVAWRYGGDRPGSALRSNQFNGGATSVRDTLVKLGFEVRKT